MVTACFVCFGALGLVVWSDSLIVCFWVGVGWYLDGFWWFVAGVPGFTRVVWVGWRSGWCARLRECGVGLGTWLRL